MNEQSELGAFVSACAVVFAILFVLGSTILGGLLGLGLVGFLAFFLIGSHMQDR
jgi:hypothetical protein